MVKPSYICTVYYFFVAIIALDENILNTVRELGILQMMKSIKVSWNILLLLMFIFNYFPKHECLVALLAFSQCGELLNDFKFHVFAPEVD